MKVILYMAITVDGFIAKEADETSFTTEIEAVVVTSDKGFEVDQPGAIVATSPEDALRVIEEKNMGKALVAGRGNAEHAAAVRYQGLPLVFRAYLRTTNAVSIALMMTR